MVAAGPVGALVGVLLGHQFDRGFEGSKRRRKSRPAFEDLSNAAHQQIFFETTFLVLGHVAKADGRVSEEEIRAARGVMHQMHLRPEHVRRAIELFDQGKRPNFGLEAQVRKFGDACRRHPDLIRAFLEIQMELALSKGTIKPRERDLLWRIADMLGVGRVELAQMEAVLRAQRSFRDNRSGLQRQSALEEAYKALGIDAQASDQAVKTAYRRLMNEHHPDKLVARGLPDSMMEVAKERTREIRSAYELIKEHRNMK